MQLGMIGLGRMGGNIVRRLMNNGHTAVVYDKDSKAVAGLAGEGATGADTLEDFVAKLEKPGTAWVMLPAGKITEATMEAWAKLMQPGDVIIDGGNTFWQDDVRRGAALKAKGLHYLDVGTSGGVWGIERGYCMMIGGDKAVVDRLDPIFQTLALGIGDIPRTPAREGRDPRIEQGYIHAGPSGAGHLVKAAIDEAVPAEVLTAALYARFRSRKDHTFAEKILSAMRAGFGGHKEPPKKSDTKA